jgi:heptosyltransferase-2
LKILLVRFSSMGDVLLTTPLVRAIRTRHPGARITFVTKQAFVPLLSHNPRLTELVAYDPATPLAELAARLRAEGFDHRLDLHGSLRSRALRWQVGGRWRGYPKHRVARSALIRFKRDLYRDRRHVVERYFDAAGDLEVQPDDLSLELFLARPALDQARDFLVGQDLGQGGSLVALVPGAAHATKRWSVPQWQRLAAMLTAAGRDVVVLGGPAERAIGADIATAGGDRAVNAAGRFDLQGSGALLKQARCAVTGDTGLMHMATAVGTPVVALFGPTVRQFGFTPYRARATILERPLDCRPCSAMGGPRCPLGHHRCLGEITPDEVFEAVRRLPR